MKSILTIWLLFFSIVGVAQNLISNPSFETPENSGDCPAALAEFNKLQHWDSRTNIVYSSGPNPTPAATHSPDWLKLGCRETDPYNVQLVPHIGTSAIYCGMYELAQQNITTLNEGLYLFSAYVKIHSADSGYQYYFRLRLSRNEMTYSSESSFDDYWNCAEEYRELNGNGIETILIPIQSGANYLGQWQYIEQDKIAVYGFYYDWIGFDIIIYDENGNERYCEETGMHVDDVSLTKECCGDYIVYQSFDNLPAFTQRRLFIRAGVNAGAPHQNKDTVWVRNGQNVYFRAGEFIDLQDGFEVESGGNFITEIAPCGNEPDTNHTSEINLDYVNQGAVLDCSNNYFAPGSSGLGTNAAFYSNGGAWYRLQLFNGLGVKVYDKIDNINSLITMYWNGSSTFTEDLADVMTAQLFIYNCFNMIFF